MKKVATTGQPPIVIPVVVVTIDIHVPLTVPPVERGEMCKALSEPPPLECSRG